VAGAAGTLAPASRLVISPTRSPASPRPGPPRPVTPGADVEDFDAFRTRVLAVYADPPQGGAQSDYVEWALRGSRRHPRLVRPNGGPRHGRRLLHDGRGRGAHGGFPQGTDGVATAETRDAPPPATSWSSRTTSIRCGRSRPRLRLAPKQNTVTFTITLPGATAELKARSRPPSTATFLTYGAPGGVVNNSDIEAAIRRSPGRPAS
jgi:hypothetical protein